MTLALLRAEGLTAGYGKLGRNRFEGTGAALLADPDVKRLYLGG